MIPTKFTGFCGLEFLMVFNPDPSLVINLKARSLSQAHLNNASYGCSFSLFQLQSRFYGQDDNKNLFSNNNSNKKTMKNKNNDDNEEKRGTFKKKKEKRERTTER